MLLFTSLYIVRIQDPYYLVKEKRAMTFEGEILYFKVIRLFINIMILKVKINI